MKYNFLGPYRVSNLCFGTSTFVKGKLNSRADSNRGKLSLEYALKSGINLIHSNPNLETQWAIRDVLKQSLPHDIKNLIKVEVPLQQNYRAFMEMFLNKVETSLQKLSVSRIAGVIYEIDKKRTSTEELSDKKKVLDNYLMARELFDKLKANDKADLLFALSDSPDDMEIAIKSKCFNGLAAYFSLFDIWPANYFDCLQKDSLDFLAIRPFRHGLFVGKQIPEPDENTEDYKRFLFNTMNIDFVEFINQFITKNSAYNSLQDLSIRFVLSPPAVKTTIVGASDIEHLNEVITAAESPMSHEDYTNLLREIKSLNFKV